MQEALLVLLQWMNPQWIADQLYNGNGLPFVLWSLIVFSCGLAAGAFYEYCKQKRVSKRKIAKGFSRKVKEAAKNALESDGEIVLGDYWESVIAFSRECPGVFVFSYELEEVGDMDTYQISPVWREYLNRHRRYLE